MGNSNDQKLLFLTNFLSFVWRFQKKSSYLHRLFQRNRPRGLMTGGISGFIEKTSSCVLSLAISNLDNSSIVSKVRQQGRPHKTYLRPRAFCIRTKGYWLYIRSGVGSALLIPHDTAVQSQEIAG